MPRQLTAHDARQSLTRHAAARGEAIRAKYGPGLAWPQLLQILQDRACVRYPCEVVFQADVLQPGELACLTPMGNQPSAGFRLCLHPHMKTDLEMAVRAVLYQLVRVNYGELASAEDAEIFGARVLGLSVDEYHASLCRLADGIAEVK